MKDGKPLSLISLEVQNVLRLTAFKMTMGPDGLVVIEAKNGQGKSSAITSLEMALAGMSDSPPDPLHGNKKKGYIIATFDDIVVKRVFRAGKPPALTITNADGTRVKGPQTLLDSLINRRCLRPTKMMEASDKEQVAMVSEIMGFDSSEYDAQIERLFGERRDAGREAKRLAAVVTETTFHEDAPDQEVSVSELMAELKQRQAHNAEITSAFSLVTDAEQTLVDSGRDIDACKHDVQAYQKNITNLEDEVRAAREQLERSESELETAQAAKTKAQATVDELTAKHRVMKVDDEAEITTQIDSADDINRKVRANAEREKAKRSADKADEEWRQWDTELKAATEAREKARLEASKRLPVPGLDISEDCLLFNGKPFSQAGASAQLRVCVAVAIAGNKDKQIRLLGIDNAEKLDADGANMVMEMARADGYQVVMTKVIQRTEDASESSVVIEDGTVKNGA